MIKCSPVHSELTLFNSVISGNISLNLGPEIECGFVVYVQQKIRVVKEKLCRICTWM